MKHFSQFFNRSLTASLAGLMLIPASVSILLFADAEARGRGVAVRGPRGGGVAVGGRGAVRAPAYRAPAVRAPAVRGVARRTARRTTRRLTTLPYGYRPYAYGGVTYYTVGGLYYEPVYEGNNVVYIQVEFDD